MGKTLKYGARQPIPIFLPGEPLWTEESDRLQSVGSQRVGHDRATKHVPQLKKKKDLNNLYFFQSKSKCALCQMSNCSLEFITKLNLNVMRKKSISAANLIPIPQMWSFSNPLAVSPNTVLHVPSNTFMCYSLSFH